MKDDTIRRLLDQYFLGETNLEEERRLEERLMEDDLPADLEPFRHLFLTRTRIKEAAPGKDFEDRLLRSIQRTQPIRRQGFVRHLWSPGMAIAASIALLIAIGLWWPSKQPSDTQTAIDWSRYEPESAEAAYSVTRQALHTMAGSLNSGSTKAMKEVEKLNILTKALK